MQLSAKKTEQLKNVKARKLTHVVTPDWVKDCYGQLSGLIDHAKRGGLKFNLNIRPTEVVTGMEVQRYRLQG
jgi:hypothetical protein